MKRHYLAWLGLLIYAVAAADAPPGKFGTVAIGSVVSDFKVVDAEGKDVPISLHGDQVTVLTIMGTNRSPGDALENVFSKYGTQGVAVVGICAGATREEFEAWRTKHKAAVTYPLVWDPAGKVRTGGIAAKVFGVGTYPMTVVIDRAGKLTGGFVGFGATSGAVLRGYLRDAGVPIPPEDGPKRAEPPPPQEDRTLKPGAVAPDFAAVDLGGHAVKLSDFPGKIVVLDFWATWCGPCISSMPHSQRVAAVAKSQGVVVFAACTSDTRAKFESWLGENGAKYPDLIFANDPNGRDAPPEKFAERVSVKLYGVNGIPCQFIIGRDGKIADVIVGFGPGDTRLEEALGRLGVKLEP